MFAMFFTMSNVWMQFVYGFSSVRVDVDGYDYSFLSVAVIFKVYDSDRNGKVSFKDMLEVLKDLSGPFMSDEQREVLPYMYTVVFIAWLLRMAFITDVISNLVWNLGTMKCNFHENGGWTFYQPSLSFVVSGCAYLNLLAPPLVSVESIVRPSIW